jgi:hypothetical protein
MNEEPKDGFGLDKAERLLAKRLGKEEEEAEQAAGLEPTEWERLAMLQEEEEEQAAGLEPPFPHVMARFDAEYFEL